jgi:hypothetical protein
VGYCEPADLTPLLDVTTILGKQILTLQRRLSTDRRS